MDRAARLQASGYRMWNVAGIEPDEFDYVKMQITSAEYPLRPEIIESAYYLYHSTHDPKYLTMGQTFLYSLVKYCRTDDGFAALKDVRTRQKDDANGELLLCGDAEISLSALCTAIRAEFRLDYLQYRGASYEEERWPQRVRSGRLAIESAACAASNPPGIHRNQRR